MIFLGATGRNDWATTMPEKNKSAFYPSVSLGFVFTELPGLKGNSILRPYGSKRSKKESYLRKVQRNLNHQPGKSGRP